MIFDYLSDLNREWVNAINKINDERHKCNGSGLICRLHFDVKSITKSSQGKLKLARGTVPVHFECSQSKVIQTDSARKSTELDVLKTEIQELQRILFKEKLDKDLEIRKKDDRIDALTQQCNHLTNKMKQMKKKCTILERQGNQSRIRLLQYVNAAHVNVNVYRHFYIFRSL